MGEVIAVPDAGFAYLSGGTTPFSNGVAAFDDHVLVRVRLRNTLPLADGLAFAASFLSDEGRPLASFAACELRSPSALSMADFIVFNSLYSDLLRANGFGAENSFPVARSNMAPCSTGLPRIRCSRSPTRCRLAAFPERKNMTS